LPIQRGSESECPVIAFQPNVHRITSSRVQDKDHQRHQCKNDANPPPDLPGWGSAAEDGEREKDERKNSKESSHDRRNQLWLHSSFRVLLCLPIVTLDL